MTAATSLGSREVDSSLGRVRYSRKDLMGLAASDWENRKVGAHIHHCTRLTQCSANTHVLATNTDTL